MIKISNVFESRLPGFDFNKIEFAKTYSDHMFMADYQEGKWQNLEILPYQNLSLSPALATLHYGQSIFEGMKAYRGKDDKIFLLRPEKNFERLNNSLIRMCMPEIPKEMFFDAFYSLLRLDQEWVPRTSNASLYIRPFVFAADPYIGVKPSATFKFMIFTCPVGAYYSGPIKVRFEEKYSRATKGGTGSTKTAGNYASTYYAAKQAMQEGFQQVIWTDSEEHQVIEECGTMNVMFVIEDVLVTPPLKDTILPGITRDSVLILARDFGIKVEERPVTVKEIIEAAEAGKFKDAFGTGTAANITLFESVSYQGKEYSLPNPSERKISQKLLKTLNGLQRGEVEDKFNWVRTLS